VRPGNAGGGRRCVARLGTRTQPFCDTAVLKRDGPRPKLLVVMEARRLKVEQAVRQLLEREQLPEPDDVEHRETSIVLLWHEQRLAVVVDLD
jgi:hypothetical protein